MKRRLDTDRAPQPTSIGSGGSQRHQCDQSSASWRRLCREEPDTSEHVLLRCPALTNSRHRLLGTIAPRPAEVWSRSAVVFLVGTFRSLQSRLATPRQGLEGQHNNNSWTPVCPRSSLSSRGLPSWRNSSPTYLEINSPTVLFAAAQAEQLEARVGPSSSSV